MRVAVTGASGFVGRSLSTALLTAGHEIVPVDLRASALPAADALVHLAAIAHRAAGRDELYRVNVELAEQVGHAAAAASMHMVYVSSVKVHGDEADEPLRESSPIAPGDAYGASKAQAEQLLRAVPGLRLTVLRPPLVYGPAVKANFLSLMRALARGIPLPLARIVNRRSLVYVGNLADAIQLCLLKRPSRTYLVADGGAVSTPELCRRLARALDRRARLFAFPPALIPIRGLTSSLEIDDGAIREELGWQPPFSFDEALRATAHWYRSR